MTTTATQVTVYSIIKAAVAAKKESKVIIAELAAEFPDRDAKKLRNEAYSLIYRFRKGNDQQGYTPEPEAAVEPTGSLDQTIDACLAAMAASPKLVIPRMRRVEENEDQS